MYKIKPISIPFQNRPRIGASPISHWGMIIIIGLVATLVGSSFSWLFPTVETWMYDWRVVQGNLASSDPSIFIVDIEEHGLLSCGPGRWNRSILAQTISALSQAGASVIAPALTLHDPPPPECGDVTGNAKLLESTKQAENVVFPVSGQSGLVHEAKAMGSLELNPDIDGVFRRVKVSSWNDELGTLPFGLAVGTVFQGSLSLLPNDGERLIRFVGPWADRPFPTSAFEELWNLIQQRDHEQLSSLVHDKFIILIPVAGGSGTLATPLEPAAPVPFIHANILNTALTNSWLTELSFAISWLMTFALALVVAWLVFDLRWIQSYVGVVGLAILYIGLAQAVLTLDGTVWPLVAPMMTVFVSSLSAGGLRVYESRVRIGGQIKATSAQLAELQEDLVKRESVVDQLEEELTEAQELAQESEIKVQELTVTAEDTNARLRNAQKEMEDTRRRLEEHQIEMRRLRKASPLVEQARKSPLPADDEHLHHECESLGIFTQDPQVLKVFQDLKKSAATNSPVLLLGETGTGKELFANAVHQLSPRAHGPFIIVNMAAISPELFESELFGHVKGAYTGAIGRRGFLETADGGTLFLDEIGELGTELQAKLLRVLEDGTFHRVGQSSPTKVDVRIVTATNRDLTYEVKQGRYREDLYYRLRSIVLRLPPLRERVSEDLDLLVHKLVEDLALRHQRTLLQITQGALEALRAYSWPGNIRELRQTLGQAVALAEGPLLTEQDLKFDDSVEGTSSSVISTEPAITAHGTGREILDRGEDEAILSCLRTHQFDMQATARALRWDRSTVTQRLKGMGFQALVDHQGNLQAAAVALAGNPSLTRIVELKLREYHKNLIYPARQYHSVEQALADCRKRFRNLPDRHFPAVETLIRQHFARENG